MRCTHQISEKMSNVQKKLTKDVYERSFVEATEAGDYKHWLTAVDVAKIQQMCYPNPGGWSSDAFDIVSCPKHLENLLNNLSISNLHPKICILNIGDQHWVTLLMPEKQTAYFIDSRGPNMMDLMNYKRTVRDCKFSCKDLSIIQQRDGSSCGLWCLLNLQQIQSWWSNTDSKSDITILLKMLPKFQTFQEEADAMQEQRREICRQLGGCPDSKKCVKRQFNDESLPSAEILKTAPVRNLIYSCIIPKALVEAQQKENDDIVAMYKQSAAREKRRKAELDAASEKVADTSEPETKRPRSVWAKKK